MIKKFNPISWVYYLLGYIVAELIFGIVCINVEYLLELRIGVGIVLCVFSGYMLFKFFEARRMLKGYKRLKNNKDDNADGIF